MQVFPAIDLRGGRCVRLLRGDYAQETGYGDDPLAMAQKLVRAGARWIHVVDLDGARSGVAENLRAIEAMAKLPVRIQTGGGIRSEADVDVRMRMGVARCVLGTAAVENPALMQWAAQAYPGRIAVGIDARGGKVAVRGWESESAWTPLALAQRAGACGVDTAVFTQIERDGTRAGADVAASAQLQAQSGLRVIVSGGVASMDDVRAAKAQSLYGIIIGKAMYDGAIDIAQALCEQTQEE